MDQNENTVWIFDSFNNKVEKSLKGSLDSIPSPSMSREHLNLLFLFYFIFCFYKKVCWQCPAIFGQKNKKLNVQESLKVMGSNPGYLLKSSLLYGGQSNILYSTLTFVELCWSSLICFSCSLHFFFSLIATIFNLEYLKRKK